MTDLLSSKDRTLLVETLSDARAYHEEEYRWEKQRIGNGGSEIAMGRARRYADAIAEAALILSQSPVETPAEPMPFKDWAADIRTQSMQDTLHAYKAKIQKLEYDLACRPSETTTEPVAWRRLINSPYEKRPRYGYSEEAFEGGEPLYARAVATAVPDAWLVDDGDGWRYLTAGEGDAQVRAAADPRRKLYPLYRGAVKTTREPGQ